MIAARKIIEMNILWFYKNSWKCFLKRICVSKETNGGIEKNMQMYTYFFKTLFDGLLRYHFYSPLEYLK